MATAARQPLGHVTNRQVASSPERRTSRSAQPDLQLQTVPRELPGSDAAARRARNKKAQQKRRAAFTSERRDAERAANSAARATARVASSQEPAQAEQAADTTAQMQAASSARLPRLPGLPGANAPRQDHVHLRDPAWHFAAGVYLNLLTSPLVHSQPLLQDHLSLSQLGAQPSPAAQQPPHGTPNNQPTSTELPAPIGPEYEPIGKLTYQMLQFVAEVCPSWSAEELYQPLSGLGELQQPNVDSQQQLGPEHQPQAAEAQQQPSYPSNTPLLIFSISMGPLIRNCLNGWLT